LQVTIADVNPSSTTSTASTTKYTVQAKMWVQHEGYDSNTNVNNIALIFLPTNVYRSSNAAISYLYLNDPEESAIFAASFFNQVADIVGFGRTSSFTAIPPRLRKATTRIVSLSDCQTVRTDANAKQICIKDTTAKNMCPGKSRPF
jgi:hypothetical protein